MGSIDFIKPLFTLLSSTVNKSEQRGEKTSSECLESNPGHWLLGENAVHCALCAPLTFFLLIKFHVMRTYYWMASLNLALIFFCLSKCNGLHPVPVLPPTR